MYKAGKIALVSPTVGIALAVSASERWFVPQDRRGRFTPGTEQPELNREPTDTPMCLPKQSEVIYFKQDENDPALVKIWATKEEYSVAETSIRERKELERQRDELDRQRNELLAGPKIRFMEQIFKRGIPIGEPTVIQPAGEMFLDDFLKKYPLDRYDRFTSTHDFYLTHKRWPETLTPSGWVAMEKDPRQKT